MPSCMRFADIHVPDELLEALDSDSLVIFVGAGVSIPKPSGIGSFRTLAAKVGKDFGRSMGEKESPDQFLGKLAKEQYAVHDCVMKHVVGAHTLPTALHGHIVRLFGSGERVRIVTTNFDTHLSRAFETSYPDEKLSQYMAPAVPCGDDFKGLVYLHGSAIDPNVRHMVVTDADFGRAYITYGWAREFLIRLFSKYTVLFVGFSHEDVVMSYLAQGLDPNAKQKRYAFVTETDDKSKWNHLGIIPVPYPEREDLENTHLPLTDLFSEWVTHSGKSLVEQGAEVRSVCGQSPVTLTPQQSALLQHSLQTPRLVRDFCDSVTSDEWITWLQSCGILDEVFSVEKLTHAQSILGSWVCSRLLCENPQLFLNLLHKRRLAVSETFAGFIADVLWRERVKVNDPRFVLLWIHFLLERHGHTFSKGMQCYVLNSLKLPEDEDAFLLLFESLTRPEIELTEPFSFNLAGSEQSRDSYSEVTWNLDMGYWIRQVLKNPISDKLNLALHGMCIRQLNRGLDLQRWRDFDVLNFGRQSIARHEQDSLSIRPGFSVVVDVARDSLVRLLQTDPQYARSLVQSYWESPYPIIKRLALFAMNHNEMGDDEERLQWLLDKQCILDHDLKKEIFDLVGETYPNVSDTHRAKVVSQIEAGLPVDQTQNWKKDSLARTQVNFLRYLKNRSPACPLLNQSIDGFVARGYDFPLSEHPELSHWSKSGFRGVSVEFDTDTILSKPPANYIDTALQKIRDDEFDGSSYLTHLRILFSKDFNWAVECTKQLIQRTQKPEHVQYAFLAWREVLSSGIDWDALLGLFESLPQSDAVMRGIASVLSCGIQKKENGLPLEMYERGYNLVLRSWEVCQKTDSGDNDITKSDWYSESINDVGGDIAEFVVYYCSKLIEGKGNALEIIPSHIWTLLNDILKGVSRTSILARVGLTPFFSFIYHWNPDLGEQSILPLFNWERDSMVANQTWTTFLLYRRGGVHPNFLKSTLPYFYQTVAAVSQLSSEAQEYLGHLLLVYAIYLDEDPYDNNLFSKVLPLLKDDSLDGFARGISSYIEVDSSGNNCWENWLFQYWENRLSGIPCNPTDIESTTMFEWCLFAGENFERAVTLAIRLNLKSVYMTSVCQDLLKTKLAVDFPDAVCTYVTYGLKCEQYPHLDDGFIVLRDVLVKAGVLKAKLKYFDDELYLRGWKG